jgi:hypothetical protein
MHLNVHFVWVDMNVLGDSLQDLLVQHCNEIGIAAAVSLVRQKNL